MYVHAHLRYGEAMAVLGEADALWEALLVANPIAVTERLGPRLAPPAQCLFQQQRRRLSPIAMRPSAEWARVKARIDRRSTAAGASIRAGRAYTSICCSPTPSASDDASGSGL